MQKCPEQTALHGGQNCIRHGTLITEDRKHPIECLNGKWRNNSLIDLLFFSGFDEAFPIVYHTHAGKKPRQGQSRAQFDRAA